MIDGSRYFSGEVETEESEMTCSICGMVLFDCDICHIPFERDDDVYCGEDRHICRWCFNKEVNKK
ncbi:MAG: hypothetical protein QXU98_07250 [Candidatus Parvarchaeota archaeon]